MNSEPKKLVPNRPTELGRQLGAELARLTEAAIEENLKRFPNMKLPCGTCAFRRGTIPNGCADTVSDALKCVVEGRDFMCHETINKETGEPEKLCAGYFIAISATRDSPNLEVPWEFSDHG